MEKYKKKTDDNSFRDDEPLPDEKDFDTHEEEIRNRVLLQKLKEEQTKHREFVRKLELEKKVKAELAEEQRQRELIANKAYIARRNASAKFRARETNERISKMLAKVDAYMKKIENLDSIDRIKLQAQKEYNEEIKKKNKKIKVTDDSIKRLAKLNNKNSGLREENIKKRKEREESEKLKREKIEQAKKINEKIQNILEKGLQTNEPKETKKAGNGLFQEEETIVGTNLSPDMMENNINRPQSTKQTRLLPPINEINDRNAEEELRQILKHDKNNMKKLLEFNKKYKNFDISSYLHTAKMNQIKSAKVVKTNVIQSSTKKNLMLTVQDGNYPTYLLACKYNSNEHIQAHLLNAKDDIEVFMMLNEKDESDRNGLMYLLIYNNLPMIKLTLLSGVILSSCKDIYGRNLIHYCCRDEISSELLDVICHCIVFENKEDFIGMNRYIEKCMKISNEENISGINECENKIKECDSEIKNVDLVEKPEERIQREKEEREKEDAKQLSVNGKVNQSNAKLTGGNVVINHRINVGEEIRKKKVPMKKLINSPDVDGKCPIHYCAIKNDLEKIKILVYYNVRLDSVNFNGCKAIDLTTSEVIQQYLLVNEKNVEAKTGKKAISNQISLNQSTISKASSKNNSNLDMEKLKFYSVEQINSFSTGYENNNYLILSVLQNNFDAFKFLLTEKKAKVDFINANGCTVLYFILINRYYSFFSFLFGLPELDNEKSLLEEISQKSYNKLDIYEPNGELTYIGQAIKIIDTQTNKNLNLLTMTIDNLNSLSMLKVVLVIYQHAETFFSSNLSPLDIIMNRLYGKNKQTILIKAVEKRNMEMIKYLLNEVHKNLCTFDLYQGDIKKMNMLHYAILNKDKEMIKFLICYDAEKNVLRKAEDAKGKMPCDYDNGKIFTNEYHHIWDACSQNDIDLLEKLVNELKYYKVDDALPVCKYTPLHVAAMHSADKAALFLVKNGCNINAKNKKKLTALELIKNDPTKSKAFIKKFEKIIHKEIKEFVDLDKSTVSNMVSVDNNSLSKNNTSKLAETINKNKKLKQIIEITKKEFENRKINVKKLFKRLDKNKNGTLEGSEFECLFTVLDIPGITSDDILLLNSYLDENKNGLIEYDEFIKILE